MEQSSGLYLRIRTPTRAQRRVTASEVREHSSMMLKRLLKKIQYYKPFYWYSNMMIQTVQYEGK